MQSQSENFISEKFLIYFLFSFHVFITADKINEIFSFLVRFGIDGVVKTSVDGLLQVFINLDSFSEIVKSKLRVTYFLYKYNIIDVNKTLILYFHS